MSYSHKKVVFLTVIYYFPVDQNNVEKNENSLILRAGFYGG